MKAPLVMDLRRTSHCDLPVARFFNSPPVKFSPFFTNQEEPSQKMFVDKLPPDSSTLVDKKHGAQSLKAVRFPHLEKFDMHRCRSKSAKRTIVETLMYELQQLRTTA